MADNLLAVPADVVRQTADPAPAAASGNARVDAQRARYAGYNALRGKMGVGNKMSEAQFYDALDKALANDGYIDQDELEAIFGVEMTDAAKADFLGGKKRVRATEFKCCMEDYVDYRRATTISFLTYADADSLRPPPRELMTLWGRLSPAEKQVFIRNNHDLVKGLLEEISRKRYDDEVRAGEFTSEEERLALQAERLADSEEQMLNDLDELEQSDSRGMRIFMQGVYNTYFEHLQANRLELTEGVRDPIVARYFVATQLKSFMLEGGRRVTKDALENLERVAGRVAKLRVAFGRQLDEIDPGANPAEFENYLALFADDPVKNRETVRLGLLALKKQEPVKTPADPALAVPR